MIPLQTPEYPLHDLSEYLHSHNDAKLLPVPGSGKTFTAIDAYLNDADANVFLQSKVLYERTLTEMERDQRDTFVTVCEMESQLQKLCARRDQLKRDIESNESLLKHTGHAKLYELTQHLHAQLRDTFEKIVTLQAQIAEAKIAVVGRVASQFEDEATHKMGREREQQQQLLSYIVSKAVQEGIKLPHEVERGEFLMRSVQLLLEGRAGSQFASQFASQSASSVTSQSATAVTTPAETVTPVAMATTTTTTAAASASSSMHHAGTPSTPSTADSLIDGDISQTTFITNTSSTTVTTGHDAAAFEDLKFAHQYLTQQYEKDRVQYTQMESMLRTKNRDFAAQLSTLTANHSATVAELSQTRSQLVSLHREFESKLLELNKLRAEYSKLKIELLAPSSPVHAVTESKTYSPISETSPAPSSIAILRREFKAIISDMQAQYERDLLNATKSF